MNLVLLLMVASTPVPTGGEGSATLAAYRVDFPAELAVTAAALSMYAVADYLIKPSLEGDTSCPRPVGNGRCNPADLSDLDRYSVGKESSGWTAFSDFALYGSLILPALYLGIESLTLPTTDPWGDWAKDLLVVSEAMALTSLCHTFFKFTFRRPRPVRYEDVNVALSTFDQELSFPSGHTSMVAAATTALTTTVFLRHPHSQVRFAVLGAGVLLTSLTAIARVEGGHHFPTDVLIGVLVGGIGGFVVPWLHKKDAQVRPVARFNPGDGSSSFGLVGSF